MKIAPLPRSAIAYLLARRLIAFDPNSPPVVPPAGDPPPPPAGDPPPPPPPDPKDNKTPPPPTPVVPEKYDLKLPDGSTLDATVIERTAATARTLGLTNENGQKMLDAIDHEVRERETAALNSHRPGGAAFEARITQYEETSLRDAEIGGTKEKLQATTVVARKAIDRFFDADLVKLLNDTGFGSHPAVVKGFFKIGKLLEEGKIDSTGAPPPTPKTTEEKWYGPQSS